MARRPPLIKRKIKLPRKTRNEQYMVNLKYLGEEPTKEQVLNNFTVTLNWYGAMCDKGEARDYLKTWLKATNRQQALKLLPRVSDTWLPLTACWLARIITNNPQHPNAEEFSHKIDAHLKESLKHLSEEKVETPTADKPSIQDRIKDKIADIIGDVEEMIDLGVEFSLYDHMKKNEIAAMYATKIADYYRPIETEMRMAMIPKGQAGSIDGYENWTKAELRARAEFYGKIVSDAERYGDVAKKVRAPRKPRAISMDKLLKHLRYQKESNEFKLASVSPESIVGAQELWTFNTKYKVVTVFRALDRGGLTVKRSSIAGYDEKNSISKGAGRSAEKVVDKIKDGGKIVLRKLMDELKSDKPLQERINENTILVRVIR